ncbi:MAG TPA: hypothetical protein VGS57_14270 [Thermoanaerobaculia bacterium]|jgi:hypothetical protein|nr:hypothetical protein [Thermoanaerobaculia bacterium]
MKPSLSPPARRRTLLAVGLLLLAAAVATATTSGPDVTVFDITGVGNYTSTGAVNGYRGYAVGTTSCNVGDQPVWWCNTSTGYCTADQHPVIAQNLYRLEAGRFEQIGLSWLKHGFLSTNSPSSTCNPQHPCAGAPFGGDQLGLGCTTPMARASTARGRWACDRGEPTAPEQRVKVLDSDLDPQ